MDTNKLTRVLALMRELELRKELYAELDRLILEMKADGFTSALIDGILLELVDNFTEGTNTVFRPAGVKRFEFRISDPNKSKKRKSV